LPSGKSYVVFGKTNSSAVDLTKLGGDSQYAIDYLGIYPQMIYDLGRQHKHLQSNHPSHRH
jgi:hypothetical protein